MTLAVVTGLLRTAAVALARNRTARGAAALLLVSACSGQAAAGGSHPAVAVLRSAPPVVQVSGAPGYLALGDSIAFGYRPLPSFADYLNPAAFTAYPEDVARALKLNLVNAACPGETTASMINTGAPSNGCETNAQGGPGYRAIAPLHVSYRGSQLSYAVRYLRQHPGTRLVTIGIGANDLFRCAETTADHCAGPDLNRTLAEVTANLDTILGALRDQARYRYTLVVVTYYALNYGDPASVTPIEALNAALAGPAARYGARLADGFAAFRAASARAGGDTCAAGLRIKLPSGGCDLHPTALGQQVLAAAIEAAVGTERPPGSLASGRRHCPAGTTLTVSLRPRSRRRPG
jgi:lysophospholipase L1-like esterase